MFEFQIIQPTENDWLEIENTYDSTVFHCQKWSKYLCKAGYRPIVIAVTEDNIIIGYFVGVKKWLGVTMMCAPMQGNGTYTQGLCFKQPVSDRKRVNVYKALAEWLFKTHKASFFQVDDWQLRGEADDWDGFDTWTQESLEEANITYTKRATLFLDMKDKTADDLWAGFHYKSAKYCINKAVKLGLKVRRIEKFEDIAEFARIHHEHVKNVHTRHGTRPKHAQSRGRIQKLCESLFPDRILMMQVVGPDENNVEQVMASCIFGYDKGECIYWTSGSNSQYLKKYSPNEVMFWEALKLIQQRGAQELNLGGMSSYKLKFGTKYAFVPRLYIYKHESIFKMKVLALNAYHAMRRLIKSE